jgi:hypothetical protein
MTSRSTAHRLENHLMERLENHLMERLENHLMERLENHLMERFALAAAVSQRGHVLRAPRNRPT